VIGSEGFEGRSILFENRYKYIRCYRSTDKRFYRPDHFSTLFYSFFAEEQLYDLQQDPGERHNLINHLELRNQAHTLFQKFFRITYTYQLVIENPEGKEITVADHQGSLLHHSREKRVLILNDELGNRTFTVRLDQTLLPLHLTAMRLPNLLASEALPIESKGEEHLLSPNTKAFAYLQRVENENLQERKIMAHDPTFEKILRDWGYLHEN
jgi:hypothetical protein